MGALLEDPRVTALQAAWRADMKALWLRIAKGIERDADAGPEQGRAQRRLDAHVEQAVRFVMQELRITWPWVAFTLMLDGGLEVFQRPVAIRFGPRAIVRSGLRSLELPRGVAADVDMDLGPIRTLDWDKERGRLRVRTA